MDFASLISDPSDNKYKKGETMSDCCLPDIRISQLPKTRAINLDDLLVLDVRRGSTDVYETRSITWGHALGIYGPDVDNGDGQDPDIIIPNPDHNIILNGTVKFLDGTELRPSITFIFDDNTGIYRPGNNTIGFTTGGTRTMVLREDYVGIGTDYPLEKLHIDEGNIQISLGDDFNGLFLGSSNRGLGGEPSVQSLGDYDLSFHVNGTMYYKFTTLGAFAISTGYGNKMDPGTDTYVLQSTGDGGPPIWTNPADIFDLTEIIQEIDDKYIGKGHLTMFPQKTVVGTTSMTSGLVTKDYPADYPDNWPNANSFIESGWEINLDNTVVRTGGDQTISNIKTLGPNAYGTHGHLVLESSSTIELKAGSYETVEGGASIQVESDGLIKIQNNGDFDFTDVDDLPDIP